MPQRATGPDCIRESEFLAQLAGGDRRSIGNANRVVRQVLADPGKFGAVIAGLSSEDPLVAMRCADAAEKISALHPDWLRPYKRILLAHARQSAAKEMRWHLAQTLPRLALTAAETRGDRDAARLSDR